VVSRGSPFLDRSPDDWVASNALAFAIRDAFPVSPGHTLVVPRRLVGSWFDATAEERAAIFELVDVVRRQLDADPHGGVRHVIPGKGNYLVGK
jgi:diadenosine tetraphosphate (Ap4A) HIT family hydrolase